MDPLVLGPAAFSAACFLACPLWPRSSPRGQLEVVPAADDTAPTSNLGQAAVCVSESVASAVVDNTPATSQDAPLARLRDVLRFRRRRGWRDRKRQADFPTSE